MATYRGSTHDSLGRRLVDAGIGTVLGSLAAVGLWVATVWWLMG